MDYDLAEVFVLKVLQLSMKSSFESSFSDVMLAPILWQEELAVLNEVAVI